MIYKIFRKEPSITGSLGAEMLAQRIIEQNIVSNRRLLYLCGDNSTTFPAEIYSYHNYEVCRALCYSTQPISPSLFSSNFYKISLSLYAAVFFSPSGVNLASESIDKTHWDQIRVFSIGETTAKALREKLGKCDGVAIKSNLEGVKELLMNEIGIRINNL
jgi:uroporphyrinogen-III synthase